MLTGLFQSFGFQLDEGMVGSHCRIYAEFQTGFSFMLKYVGLVVVMVALFLGCMACYQMGIAQRKLAQDRLRREYNLQRTKNVRNAIHVMHGAMARVTHGLARSRSGKGKAAVLRSEASDEEISHQRPNYNRRGTVAVAADMRQTHISHMQPYRTG